MNQGSGSEYARSIDVRYDKNSKVRIQPEDTLSAMHMHMPA